MAGRSTRARQGAVEREAEQQRTERRVTERRAEPHWLEQGHELLGRRVRRYTGGERVAQGKIVSWLPAGRDAAQFPLLFRIIQDQSSLPEEVGDPLWLPIYNV